MLSSNPPFHPPPPTGVTNLVLVYQAHGSGLCLLPLTVLLPVIDHAQASCELEDAVKGRMQKNTSTDQQGIVLQVIGRPWTTDNSLRPQ